MMPNMDPRTMKNLMAKMGIKSSEISAERVVIETNDLNIIIENPQVTRIEAQGAVSFQIMGDVSEAPKASQVNITDEDIDLVAEKTGITDKALIKEKLLLENGDIAKAILDLSNENEGQS
jgi:nascent polypeptide-associated complex subunit alpha